MSKLPDDYFCPKCNAKATHDFVESLKADLNMPTVYIVSMAMNILFEAKCPAKLLKPIAEWSKSYGENLNELSEEEQDKLKLLNWKNWAKGGLFTKKPYKKLEKEG